MSNWIRLDFENAHLAAGVLQLIYGDKRIDHTKVKVSASLGSGGAVVERIEIPEVGKAEHVRIRMRASKKLASGKKQKLTAAKKAWPRKMRPFDVDALREALKKPNFSKAAYARKAGVSESLVYYHQKKLKSGKPYGVRGTPTTVNIDDLRAAMKEEGFKQAQYAKKTGLSISAVFRAMQKLRDGNKVEKARQRLAPEA